MKKFLFFIFVIFSIDAFATHNRAGEITYRHIAGFDYEATIVTYTNTLNTQADRNFLVIYWGDGDSLTLTRSNGPDNVTSGTNAPPPDGVPDGEQLDPSHKKNIYVGRHTYPGGGNYWLSMQDPNRNDGILNIPNSVNIEFYINTLLVINDILGPDNSPILMNPPIDLACDGQCFYHNPAAYDPDGDSLSYELAPCLAGGAPIPGYTLPNILGGGAISIDAYTGELTWCAPTTIGEFNVAILVKEWRSGYLIGEVERDMQIDVVPCDDQPPVIHVVRDTCIEAGKNLVFPVSVTDIHNDAITLTAAGGPVNTNFPAPQALFNPVTAFAPLTAYFSWQTQCNHVHKQPYEMVFEANDNGSPVALVDYQTTLITVIGPAPKNYSAAPSGSSMVIKWDPDVCSFATPNNVISYKIYRHSGFTGWKHGPCETDVPAYTGYALIGTTGDINTTTFTDNDNGHGLVHGIDYCYMIVAVYADGSISYATDEFCNKLIRDVPIITNVSVDSTSTVGGMITLKWIKPLADPSNFDTIANPGPYEYKLMQATGFTGALAFNQVASFSSPSFAGLSANSYTATALNTSDNPYTYRIDFYSNNLFKGSTNTASSIYLSLTPNDNQLKLDWQEYVPWDNYMYYIYRKNNAGNYVLFDSTTTQTYIHKHLVNLSTYCYQVKSKGKYTDTNIVSPLINFSEEKCGIPVDLTPPCSPSFSISADCPNSKNTLTWANPNFLCPIKIIPVADTIGTNDVIMYKIYFSAIEGQNFELIKTVNLLSDTTFIYKDSSSIAGCFAVTAVDSFMNESPLGPIICIDNCPNYELPNVFTPNGDGNNDLFIPFPYKYVKDIELKIFDRWGLPVFETIDPNINWNGKNQFTRKNCMDGVYFYVCKVNEIHVTGIKPREITGFIQLFRNK